MSARPSRVGGALTNLLLGLLALGLSLGAFELAFRTLPPLVPKGIHGSGRFAPELGMNVHGGTVVYNKLRFVRRTPNRDGFMDVDHERSKPAGVERVGFFGDSYVEALQHPLDQVFFRLLPQEITGRRVETFGFGLSSWGTVHDLVVWRVFGPRYDLDTVVYVFVENDPGDNTFRIQEHWNVAPSPKPFAVLSDEPPGFALRWLTLPDELPLWLRAMKAVQSHSLLAQIALSRVNLLRERGIQMQKDARQMAMATRASGAVPEPNDAPSSWPAEYRDLAAETTRRLLAGWRDEVVGAGHRFLVLYVPRGESQLTGELPVSDTWRPWLGESCAALHIPLVDPSSALAEKLREGVHVYDDHWSVAGHQVIANVLAGVLERLGPASPGSPGEDR